jgi:hypothetical protein
MQSAPTINNSGPNLSNTGGGKESREQSFGRSVAKSASIKEATGVVIATRQDFANYLAKGGLRLLTSALIFEKTGDFVESSFVVYPQSKNAQEPLAKFLLRYPNLVEAVGAINEALKPVQGQMTISGR